MQNVQKIYNCVICQNDLNFSENLFLVGAFSLRETARLLQWVVFFFFSAYNLTLNGPLFTICSSVLLFIFD